MVSRCKTSWHGALTCHQLHNEGTGLDENHHGVFRVLLLQSLLQIAAPVLVFAQLVQLTTIVLDRHIVVSDSLISALLSTLVHHSILIILKTAIATISRIPIVTTQESLHLSRGRALGQLVCLHAVTIVVGRHV